LSQGLGEAILQRPGFPTGDEAAEAGDIGTPVAGIARPGGAVAHEHLIAVREAFHFLNQLGDGELRAAGDVDDGGAAFGMLGEGEEGGGGVVDVEEIAGLAAGALDFDDRGIGEELLVDLPDEEAALAGAVDGEEAANDDAQAHQFGGFVAEDFAGGLVKAVGGDGGDGTGFRDGEGGGVAIDGGAGGDEKDGGDAGAANAIEGVAEGHREGAEILEGIGEGIADGGGACGVEDGFRTPGAECGGEIGVEAIGVNVKAGPIALRLAGAAEAKDFVPLCSRMPPEASTQETAAPRDGDSHIAPPVSASVAKVAMSIRAKRTTSAKNATGVRMRLP